VISSFSFVSAVCPFQGVVNCNSKRVLAAFTRAAFTPSDEEVSLAFA
jgi:hypothetical protein